MTPKQNYSKTRSLTFRVIMITFAIIFAALLLLSFYAGNILYANTFEDTQRYSFQLFEQAGKNITSYIRAMDNISAVSSKQSDVMKFLLNDTPTETDFSRYYQSMNDVRSFLKNLTVAQDNIECVTIIHDLRGYYVNNSTGTLVSDYYPFREQDWYAQAVARPGETVYLPPHIPDYPTGVGEPVTSYARAISMYDGGAPIGVILIDLKNSVFESILDDISLGESGYAYIINSQGDYIYYPDAAFLSTGKAAAPFADSSYTSEVLGGNTSFIAENSAGENNAVFSTPVEGTDWFLVGVIPYEQINTPAVELRAAQLVTGLAVAAIICILLAMVLRGSVFQRLSGLRSAMAEVETGNLDVAFHAGQRDEIGQLGDGFNEMIGRINNLIDDITNTENQKRKAEFAALQAQINPHFLYNTLDSIVWMAETNPAGASEMAYLLAMFFRQSLSGGADIIPLSRELSITDAYLHIQKIRYDSYFDYDIHYTAEVADFPIPKLIVQPLVENAIYHGIKQSGRKCHLSIWAYRHGDHILIKVVDDGVGMGPGMLKDIMDGRHKPTGGMSGVGVRNVDERIKLHFTENSGLYYLSHEGLGTEACIYIYAPVE